MHVSSSRVKNFSFESSIILVFFFFLILREKMLRQKFDRS